jgi:hypothetical protein
VEAKKRRLHPFNYRAIMERKSSINHYGFEEARFEYISSWAWVVSEMKCINYYFSGKSKNSMKEPISFYEMK